MPRILEDRPREMRAQVEYLTRNESCMRLITPIWQGEHLKENIGSGVCRGVTEYWSSCIQWGKSHLTSFGNSSEVDINAADTTRTASSTRPLIHGRWQQKSGVTIDRSKVAHGVHRSEGTHMIITHFNRLSQTGC
jgi:hypothetical protein